MKRIILSLMAISCVGVILAQDIVVLKAGTTIEDVMVLSMTVDNVTYKQAGTQKTIVSSEVDGVLYSDGRYVSVPSKQNSLVAENTEIVNDSWGIDDGFDKNREATSPTYTQSENHVVYDILFMNKSYSKECRKAGERVFSETYAVEVKKIKQVLKSMTKKERKVAKTAVFEKAMNASNDAVLECSELKNQK